VSTIEERILQAAAHQDGYARLMQVPGLGKALSAIVFYETGDVSRFPSARHYSSYCRLVPGTADSGGHSKPGRGAKQGNPHLKAAFTQAAQCAVRHYPSLRDFYERQAGRHPGRGSRLIATDILGHRLALAAYHILKEGTDYDDKKLFTS
jgi:transposase